MKIAIIGAGIGGLATAIRLGVQGHSVTVYEKNEYPGGKIAEIRVDGFRFDTGPSLFTLPQLAEELFRMCGEEMKDHIPYTQLETNCKYFYPDGSKLTFYHAKGLLSKELNDNQIKDPTSVFKRLKQAEEVYTLSAPVFLFSDFHKFSNFSTPPYKKIATKLHKLDFMRTMHGANKHDFADYRLVKIFDRYATYNGSNPYRAPATLNMIAHLENNIGAFFPEKGMYSIVDGLYKLAVRQGVRFHFGEKVEKITVLNKKASGVETVKGQQNYDLIVSDVDVKYLSQNLIKDYPLKKRLRRAAPSSSALIFYWRVDKRFDDLELHNILFSKDYKLEFNSLFKHKTISDDPTVYIFVSSKAVHSDAPSGCENWFVMVNAPSDTGQHWDTLIADTRRSIIGKINSRLSADIARHITGEQVASPLTIAQNTMSAGGALYGASSNSMWSAFLRHPNHMTQIDNLYFVGGSVHPGGGIPLCLASAQIVCDQINDRYGKTN